MAKVTPLQHDFARMMQDVPRYAIPRDAVWNMQDWIPNLGANLRGRGGWKYHSNDISDTASGATYVNSLAYAPFTGGAKLCALTDNSKFVTIASDGTVTLVTASAHTTVAPWTFHANRLIIPVGDGTTAPRTYDGTTYGALAGSPPAGKYAVAWRAYTVISGNHSTDRRRVYFSIEDDPTATWNTTAGWISTTALVTGLAALPSVMLVFGETQTARIRGSASPPGGDMTLDDPLFNVGCTDARSIAVDSGICCFANPTGVYLTNGTINVEDLTATSGLKNHWKDTLASYSSTWTIAGGFHRHLYIVTIMDGSTFKDSYVFDPISRAGWRNTNMKFLMFAPAWQIGEELYAASRATDRVVKLSTMWSPSATYKNDDDGTAVTPILETPFYDDQRGAENRYRDVYLRYDLRDAASDNPSWTVSYITEPDGSYTAISSTLGETTGEARTPLAVRRRGRGIGFKVAQTNAASASKVVAFETMVREREQSR